VTNDDKEENSDDFILLTFTCNHKLALNDTFGTYFILYSNEQNKTLNIKNKLHPTPTKPYSPKQKTSNFPQILPTIPNSLASI